MKKDSQKQIAFKQTDLFSDTHQEIIQEHNSQTKRKRDRKIQETILELQKKFGSRNVVLKASDLVKGSTTIERNNQIGGHHA